MAVRIVTLRPEVRGRARFPICNRSVERLGLLDLPPGSQQGFGARKVSMRAAFGEPAGPGDGRSALLATCDPLRKMDQDEMCVGERLLGVSDFLTHCASHGNPAGFEQIGDK